MSVRGRWIKACLVGELVGFVPPAVTGAVLGALGAPDVALIAGLTIAGTAEGAILGWRQGVVVHGALRGVAVRRWVIATAAAAAFAWLVGMGGAPLFDRVGPAVAVVYVPLAALALWSMGGLQAGVMADAVADVHHWAAVTALAWLVGVTIPIATMSLLPASTPAAVTVVAAVAAAVAMGVTVGAITGASLARIVTDASRREDRLDVPGQQDVVADRHDRSVDEANAVGDPIDVQIGDR